MARLHDLLESPGRQGRIEFVIEERTTERVVSRMPVTPGVLNPLGRVQAGAMIWLADVTASVLALQGQAIGDDGQGFPLAIDIHSSLVGNQSEGEIRAEARFVSRGRHVLVIRTRITGKEDRLLAEVTTTHTKARGAA